MHVFDDLAVLLLAICLIVCVAAIVTLTLVMGKDVLAGTGLGGMIVVLGGALAARVKNISQNGKGQK